MRLVGKSLAELETLLADMPRAELVRLIHRLTNFEQLLTSRQIAEATQCRKRDVLEDMKAGRFVDPILGRGFFCRSANSVRVSAAAANAWRETFFVRLGDDPITRSKKGARALLIGVNGKKARQRATTDQADQADPAELAADPGKLSEVVL
jgi:hypothetical protein